MTAQATWYDSDGATALTAKQLADIFAGANDTPIKFGAENTGTRTLGLAPSNNVQLEIDAVGTNDGSTMIQIATEPTTLSRPYGVTGVVSAGGGSFGATGNYGYEVTATNAAGETVGSAEVSVTVGAVTQSVVLSWTQVASATGYKVYRTATPGTYGASTLLTTIGSGATVTYTDTGIATTTGTPPTANTTGIWVVTLTLSGAGAGGVWSGTGVQYYRVAALDSTGAILVASLELNVNVDVVTKTVTVAWPAVSGAATYNVYRSTVSGTYSPTALVTSGVTGTSYVDTGTATITGSLTTAATYGVPPAAASFSVNPIAEGLVVQRKQLFFWVRRVVPANTPETGNIRQALVTLKET